MRRKGIFKSEQERLSNKNNLIQEEEQFLKQYSNFGADVGLFSFFFFNLLNLKPGQAIFTDAGEPHAYIEGNIIECMANSDNVVRAGLTNKYKDVDTLIDVIKYNFKKYNIINEEQIEDNVIFKTSAEEFQLTLYKKEDGFSSIFLTYNKPVVVLILEGALEIENTENSFSENFKKGESFLIPALMEKFILKCLKDSRFIIVEIPMI